MRIICTAPSRSRLGNWRFRTDARRDRTLLSRSRTLLSRDREGAVCLRYKNRHRFPLLLNNIPDGCSNVVPIPQPTRTSVPRPSFSIRLVRARAVQSPARIRFEVTHHLLGSRFSLHNGVNVIGPHMCRQKRPVAVRTDLLYRIEHCVAARRIQQKRNLVHQVALARYTRLVGLNHAMSRNIVVPIHGTGFIAVQMGAVARERNQVRQVRSFYTAPSRSRLGKARSRLGRITPG
jgi:hypothetical protein